ncbi:AAA family ATPase [Marinomonas gallaica]|uniref:AAA family ATPase n=1 Tax=Marinomonas gallaica TaxID=1806667 RepID=UPI003CE4B898
MIGLKLEKFKIVLNTTDGEYGFECEFKSGLNIVRGNNSSGKSTLVNSLIYSLGMEEILGGKGEKTLPYALKEYVESENKDKIRIVSSYVYLQI